MTIGELLGILETKLGEAKTEDERLFYASTAAVCQKILRDVDWLRSANPTFPSWDRSGSSPQSDPRSAP